MEKSRKNAIRFCLKEEERINTVLEELSERGKIDEVFLRSIKPVEWKLPRLCGLAKIDKNNIPVRPVLSMPRSLYSGTSNYGHLCTTAISWFTVSEESPCLI